MPPRRQTATRTEMVHENPITSPIVVALIREKITDMRHPSSTQLGDQLPVQPEKPTPTALAFATMLEIWTKQIEALHADVPDDDE
jgi:hypothetical protein